MFYAVGRRRQQHRTDGSTEAEGLHNVKDLKGNIHDAYKNNRNIDEKLYHIHPTTAYVQ
jgi:hypothetical protein